jgi:hypothetical protein
LEFKTASHNIPTLEVTVFLENTCKKALLEKLDETLKRRGNLKSALQDMSTLAE